MPPPRKKTACGAACPRYRNNFRPQGRSAAGKRNCRAKAARTRAQKQPRRGPGAVRRLRPRGSGGQWGCLVAESDLTGCPPRQRARSGAKTAPARAGDCAQAAPWGNGRQWGVWCRESTALGTRRGRGHARAQKQPPAGPEAVWMRDMGVTCPGRSV